MYRKPPRTFQGTVQKIISKASPLREKLSENRLYGADFLTDVGDAAPTGRWLSQVDKHFPRSNAGVFDGRKKDTVSMRIASKTVSGSGD